MTTSPNGRDPVLSVTDFGPIVEANVDLRPLTVFVGPSNTGKSYLAALIYALHRFFSGYRVVGYRGRRPLPFFLHRRSRSPGKTTDVPKETLNAAFRWAEEVAEKVEASGPAGAAGTALPDSIAGLIRPILEDVEDMGRSLDEEITRCFGVVEEIPLDVEGGTFPAGYGEITESICNDWAMISNRIADARSR